MKIINIMNMNKKAMTLKTLVYILGSLLAILVLTIIVMQIIGGLK